VQFDRRKGVILDHAGVIEKFGVEPESIPDYLGLVGDTADGFPGLPGWGAKSTSTVLARYSHIEAIPAAAGQWEVSVRGGAKLAKVLADNLDDALLFRRIATLETDIAELGTVDDLEWLGPQPGFVEMCEQIDGPLLAERAANLAERLDE
jgi:5'-3' exonuclease